VVVQDSDSNSCDVRFSGRQRGKVQVNSRYAAFVPGRIPPINISTDIQLILTNRTLKEPGEPFNLSLCAFDISRIGRVGRGKRAKASRASERIVRV
jgi:hypothetical protein